MKKEIIFYIPSIEGGGVEKNLYLLIKYLPKQIGKIHIITAKKKNSNFKNVKFICPTSNYWNKKPNIKNIICVYLLIKNFCFKSCNFVFSVKLNINNYIKNFLDLGS